MIPFSNKEKQDISLALLSGFFLKATLWPDFTELFAFLVRIS